MENKKRTSWKLYSKATWTLNELANVIVYGLAFVCVGMIIGWILSVSAS